MTKSVLGGRRGKCPVLGCTHFHATNHVMCHGCWLQVPQSLKAEIKRLARSEPGSDAHFRAIDDAVQSVPPTKATTPPAKPEQVLADLPNKLAAGESSFEK